MNKRELVFGALVFVLCLIGAFAIFATGTISPFTGGLAYIALSLSGLDLFLKNVFKAKK